VPPLSLISQGSVSSLNPSAPLPPGNAETIANSLGPFFNQPEHDLIFGAASTGFFSYNEPSCGGINTGESSGAQLASVGISSGIGAIPIAGPLLSKLFNVINPLAHHAAAVKTEQATLCRAVPEANNFLRQIDAAVSQGQLDVATAAQALEQGYQNWLVEVKPIYKTGAGKNCNAACVYAKAFRAAIEMRKQNYALIQNSAASGAQGVVGGVVNAVENAFTSIASSLTGSSQPSLAQAGLTPARQSSMAIFLVIAGLGVSAFVFAKLFGGK